MGKLHIGAADYLHLVHNLVGLLLKPGLQFRGNGQHGGRAERVSGMYPQRINVLDKADGDHIASGVPHHFQFQLFPAQNGFLHQHLSHQGSLQAPGADCPQFLHIVHQTAACAAHGIGRAQYHRIAQSVGNDQCLLHRVGHLTAGHLDPQLVHGLFKFYAVLSPFDGVHLHTDHFHIVLVQHARACQFGAEV